MKIIILNLLFTLFLINAFAQSKNDVDILVSNYTEYKKELICTDVKFIFIDKVTKDTIPSTQIFFYLDRVAVNLIDTKRSSFFLLKGKHTFFVRCFGYKKSSTVKFKARLDKLYTIIFYLIPEIVDFH